MACGQCMAVCPTKAIEISGREISVDDLVDLSEITNKSNFEQLKNLMVGRRSARDFKDKEIAEELIEKIIESSSYAPMGIPPSDVQLMIGSIHPIIQYGAKKLKKKWNIPAKTPSGIVVIFGYPKYRFKSGIKRSFADVTFFSN
jgi:ferredoxin